MVSCLLLDLDNNVEQPAEHVYCIYVRSTCLISQHQYPTWLVSSKPKTRSYSSLFQSIFDISKVHGIETKIKCRKFNLHYFSMYLSLCLFLMRYFIFLFLICLSYRAYIHWCIFPIFVITRANPGTQFRSLL